MIIKNSLGIIIFEILVFFVFASSALSFDYSAYKPSTISAEFNQMLTEHQEMFRGPKPVDVLIHPTVPFSIIAKYLNEEREISNDNKKSLEIFAKAFDKPFVLELFKHEILVRDADNREYWLPIQESLTDDLHVEYYKECKLTLYLVISIINNRKPLIFINEFRVE
jgi:hypothetical protein